MPAED